MKRFLSLLIGFLCTSVLMFAMLCWRGQWSSTASYVVGDVVGYNGSSFVAVVANSNLIPPQNLTTWNILALQGVSGPVGPQGSVGPQGVIGPQGVTGSAGPVGLQGAPGSQGIVGLQGASGSAGSTGSVGPTGLQGVVGSQGIQGAPGLQGSVGPIGLPGSQGSIGLQGAPGYAGLNGSVGLQGAPGSQGMNGAVGSAGPIGITWLGVWSSSITYVPTNVVSYSGASYIAILSSNNVPPGSNNAVWQLLANAGINMTDNGAVLSTPEGLSVTGPLQVGTSGLGCAYVFDITGTNQVLWCGSGTMNTFASAPNGSFMTCTDCDSPPNEGAVCTNSGNHSTALLFRIRGVSLCF